MQLCFSTSVIGEVLLCQQMPNIQSCETIFVEMVSMNTFCVSLTYKQYKNWKLLQSHKRPQSIEAIIDKLIINQCVFFPSSLKSNPRVLFKIRYHIAKCGLFVFFLIIYAMKANHFLRCFLLLQLELKPTITKQTTFSSLRDSEDGKIQERESQYGKSTWRLRVRILTEYETNIPGPRVCWSELCEQ